MSVESFEYTGAAQSFVVPAGVTSLSTELWGAQGDGLSNPGAKGGYLKATIPVTPGETLQINVGAHGTSGSGGGASDIRQSGTTLANRVAVAGAGGGTGANTGGGGGTGYPGGVGGGLTGAGPGSGGSGDGSGGTQSAGGAAGATASAGTLGVGGAGAGSGGGGGAGYWGGGGGGTNGSQYRGGGGGGSSYSSGTIITNTQNVQSGDGAVIITWEVSGGGPSANAGFQAYL